MPAAILQARDARMTYRLESGSALVTIRPWLAAAGTAGGNVWIVRLLAVGHGGGGGEFGLLEACDRWWSGGLMGS